MRRPTEVVEYVVVEEGQNPTTGWPYAIVEFQDTPEGDLRFYVSLEAKGLKIVPCYSTPDHEIEYNWSGWWYEVAQKYHFPVRPLSLAETICVESILANVPIKSQRIHPVSAWFYLSAFDSVEEGQEFIEKLTASCKIHVKWGKVEMIESGPIAFAVLTGPTDVIRELVDFYRSNFAPVDLLNVI